MANGLPVYVETDDDQFVEIFTALRDPLLREKALKHARKRLAKLSDEIVTVKLVIDLVHAIDYADCVSYAD